MFCSGITIGITTDRTPFEYPSTTFCLYHIFLVANPRDVIELLTFVHEQVLEGKSTNAALKMAKKDRKTMDRFKNIYYLHVLNSDKLEQVSHHVCNDD